jgi:hypothetical protein
MWKFLTLSVAVAILSDSSRPAHSQEIDLKDFKRLYAKEAARLSAHYERSGMVYDYRREYRSVDPERWPDREESSENIYKSNDLRHRRLEVVRADPSGGERRTVRIVNPQGYFRLYGAATASYSQMEVFWDDPQEGIDDLPNIAVPPAAPFGNPLPLVDFFSHPGQIRFTRCRLIGGRYVIDYDYLLRTKRWAKCRIVLDAERCMAQIEHTRSINSPDDRTFTVRYDGEAGGVPLVQRVERTQTDETGFMRETWEVREHLPGPFDDGTFSPSGKGRGDRADPRRVPPWMDLLASFSACLMGFGIFLWLRGKSRARAES